MDYDIGRSRLPTAVIRGSDRPHLAVEEVKQGVEAGSDEPAAGEAREVKAGVEGAVRGDGEEACLFAVGRSAVGWFVGGELM
jgi:hypothetical protein